MKSLLLPLLLVLVSCASQQPGKYADVVEGEHPTNVPITGFLDNDLKSDHFTVVHVTFGNRTPEWVRVKEVLINLPDGENTYVVLGEDLQAWAKATQEKIKIENHNTQMFLAGVAAAGAVMAVTAKSDGAANTGLAVMGASSLAITARDTTSHIRNLNRGNMLPEGHLLAPFPIPPGLVARRWLVLQTPVGKKTQNLSMTVRYLDGREAKYQVAL